ASKRYWDLFRLTQAYLPLLPLLSILSGPKQLPRFWIFMYRVNPFTYVVEGFLGTSLANAAVRCADNEYVTFASPAAQTCGQYLANYIAVRGGYLSDPNAGNGAQCQYCALANTNAFLSSIGVEFGHRWRNFGFLWIYTIFNLAMAALIYWLVRMPKKSRVKG
ncbi:ATP-dependent permease PDR15, partial [Colletotrichum tanaceti]